MEAARHRAGRVPSRILTDGWKGYLDGIELAYGADAKHIVTDPFGTADNTELIERWHSTLKDRTKTLRGLKSPETAERFLDGFLVYYNHLRPHEFLSGKTPAEAAGVHGPIKTWVDVVRFASPQVQVLVTPAQVDILSEREPLIRPVVHRKYDIDKKRQRRKALRREHRLSRKSVGAAKPETSVSRMRGI